MKRLWIWLIAAGAAWSGWQFQRWRQACIAELGQNGTRVETAVGPIEYTIDGDVPYSHAQFVAQTVPQAELITLPNAGHLIWPAPQWAVVKNQLATFLNKEALAKGISRKDHEKNRS